MIEQFHFIRPAWLLALLPLLMLCGMLFRRHLLKNNWKTVVDEALQPHLLIDRPVNPNILPVLTLFFAGLLAILAMAGPSWEKLPQPVFKKHAALMIVLDLSRAMDAIDLKPDRITRARFKITDILQRREEGQTGLIVYAADPYTVSPLTEDTATIDALLDSLSTDIMPADGHDTGKALLKAAELLENAGFDRGDVLLVTGSIEKSAEPTIQELHAQGYTVSLLAVGTENGGPILLEEGGFIKDQQGQPVIARLDMAELHRVMESGDGLFTPISIDDSDIDYLMPLIEIGQYKGEEVETDIETDIWREFGPWLLIVLLPLAALAFRRGCLVIALCIFIPWPQPASALDWDEWFVSANQRALKLFEQDKFEEAAELFDDVQWKASAYYRARQYQLSINILEDINTADAHYNRGNALTRQNEISKAIEAYSAALELDPEHEDAKYNKELLEQQQKKQEGKRPEEQEEDESKESQAADDGDLEATPGQDEQSDESGKPSPNEQQSQSETESTEEQAEEASPKNEQQDESSQQTTEVDTGAGNPKNQSGQEEQLERQESNDQKEELSEQAYEEWLNKVPDDPGGLLRRKFKYLHGKQKKNGS